MIPKNAKRPWRRTDHQPADGVLLDGQIYSSGYVSQEMLLAGILAIAMRGQYKMTLVDRIVHGRCMSMKPPLPGSRQGELCQLGQLSPRPHTKEEACRVAVGHNDPCRL